MERRFQSWKKRFFVLNFQERTLAYFGGPNDTKPKGVMEIGSITVNTRLDESVSKPHAFAVLEDFSWNNPTAGSNKRRKYLFACDTKEDKDVWISMLSTAKKMSHMQLAKETVKKLESSKDKEKQDNTTPKDNTNENEKAQNNETSNNNDKQKDQDNRTAEKTTDQAISSNSSDATQTDKEVSNNNNNNSSTTRTDIDDKATTQEDETAKPELCSKGANSNDAANEGEQKDEANEDSMEKETPASESHSTTKSKQKAAHSNTIEELLQRMIHDLAEEGLEPNEIWDGIPKLFKLLMPYKPLLLTQKGGTNVVTFHLPTENGDTIKKCYKIDRQKPIAQIIKTLAKRINLRHPKKYELTTLSGYSMDTAETLQAYGLGSLFQKWELKLAPKSSVPAMTTKTTQQLEGTYSRSCMVVFWLPSTVEFAGSKSKMQKVNVLSPITQVIETLCAKFNVSKSDSKAYEICTNAVDDEPCFVLQRDLNLAAYGLGDHFEKCELVLKKESELPEELKDISTLSKEFLWTQVPESGLSNVGRKVIAQLDSLVSVLRTNLSAQQKKNRKSKRIIKHKDAEIKKNAEQRVTLTEYQAVLTNALTEMEQQNNNLRQENISHQQDCEALTTEKAILEKQIQSLTTGKQLLHKRLEETENQLTQTVHHANTVASELRSKIENLRDEVEISNAKVEQLTVQLQEEQNDWAEQQGDYETEIAETIAVAESNKLQLKQQIAETNQLRTEKAFEIEELKREIEFAVQTGKRNVEEVQAQKQEVEGAKDSEIHSLLLQLTTWKSKFESSQNEILNLTKQYEESNEEIEGTKSQLQNLQTMLQQQVAELNKEKEQLQTTNLAQKMQIESISKQLKANDCKFANEKRQWQQEQEKLKREFTSKQSQLAAEVKEVQSTAEKNKEQLQAQINKLTAALKQKITVAVEKEKQAQKAVVAANKAQSKLQSKQNTIQELKKENATLSQQLKEESRKAKMAKSRVDEAVDLLEEEKRKNRALTLDLDKIQRRNTISKLTAPLNLSTSTSTEDSSSLLTNSTNSDLGNSSSVVLQDSSSSSIKIPPAPKMVPPAPMLPSKPLWTADSTSKKSKKSKSSNSSNNNSLNTTTTNTMDLSSSILKSKSNLRHLSKKDLKKRNTKKISEDSNDVADILYRALQSKFHRNDNDDDDVEELSDDDSDVDDLDDDFSDDDDDDWE